MPPRRRPPRPGALTELPPLKIIRKILLLQILYYVSATVLIVFTALVAGTAFTGDLILSWQTVRGDTTIGWMLGLVWMLNSFICIIFLLLIVSRSKLIPDFALTIHFIHLVIVSLYTHSLPTNLLWWGLQMSSAALMTFGSIWACQRRELRPITFGLGGNRANDGNRDNNHQNSDEATVPLTAGHEDLESGLAAGATAGHGPLTLAPGRGRRGRNRDGGGDYEMVTMNDKDSNAATATAEGAT